MSTSIDSNNSPLISIVPKDAYIIRSALHKAAVASDKGFWEAHTLAPIYASGAVLLSTLSAPCYVGRGTGSLIVGICNLDLVKGVIDFSSDLFAACECLIIGTFGVMYVALGILFPQTMFKLFEPLVGPTEIELQTIPRQPEVSIEELENRLEEIQQQLERANLERDHIEIELNDERDAHVADNQERDGLQGELNNERDAHVADNQERDRLQGELDDERAVHGTDNERLQRELNDERAAHGTDNERLQGELNDERAAHGTDNERLQRELNDERTAHETDNDRLQRELGEERDVHGSEFSQLQTGLRNERDTLVRESEKLRDKLVSEGQSHIRDIEAKDRLQSELERKREDNERLQRELNQARAAHVGDEEIDFGDTDDRAQVEKANLRRRLLDHEGSRAELTHSQILQIDRVEHVENQKLQVENALLRLLLDCKQHEAVPQIGKFGNFVSFLLGELRNGEKKTIRYGFSFGKEDYHFNVDISDSFQLKCFIEELTQHYSWIISEKERSKISYEEVSAVICDRTLLERKEEDLTRSFIELSNSKTEEDPVIVVESQEQIEVKPKPQPGYLDSLMHWISDGNHPSKVHKYRVVLNSYIHALSSEYNFDLPRAYQDALKRFNGDESKVMQKEFAYLLQVLLHPIDPNKTDYSDARGQYLKFVELLRGVIQTAEYQKIQNLPSEALTPEQRIVRDSVRTICMVRWAHNEMFSYLEEITDLTLKAYRESIGEASENGVLSAENLGRIIREEVGEIKKAPDTVKKPRLALEYQKFLGALGQSDYTATQNTPNVHSHATYANGEGDRFDVAYLRHGTPNIPGSYLGTLAGVPGRLVDYYCGTNIAPYSHEKVAPDYLEFVAAMLERGDALLFCSHQRYLSNIGENESDRVRELLSMQDQFNNAFIFVQNVDGDLFKRKGDFNDMQSFDALKKTLQESFYNPDESGSILPKALRDISIDAFGLEENEEDVRSTLLNEKDLPEILMKGKLKDFFALVKGEEVPEDLTPQQKKQLLLIREARHYKFHVLPKLLEDVHHLFFDGSDKIKDTEEWQSFILAFFVFQKMDLKFRVRNRLMPILNEGKKPAKLYYTTPCKDFLDRGGNMAFCEGRMHDYMLGQEEDPAALEARRVNLEGPPIAVKKKEPIPGRIEPGLKLDERLFLLSAEKKRELREYSFEGWKARSYQTKVPSNQSATPTLSSARTPEEIFTFLRALQVSDAWGWQDYTKEAFAVSAGYKKEGCFDAEAIFDQVNKDLKRTQNVKISVDGIDFDGSEGKDAQVIFNLLMQNKLIHGDQEKALEVLALFQQGIGANLWGKLKEILDSKENALGVFEKRDESEDYISRKFELKTSENEIEIEFSTEFSLKAEDLLSPIYRDRPFADLIGYVKVSFSNRNAAWNWNIRSVYDNCELEDAKPSFFRRFI